MRYNQVAMPEVDEKTNFYSVRLELVSHVDEKANFNSTMSNGAMLMRNPNFNAVRLDAKLKIGRMCQMEPC